MKVLVFGIREGEEQFFYDDEANNHYGFQFTFVKGMLSMDNIDVTKGYEAICIVVSCVITKEVAAALQKNGVKFILTRAAGTDHLDVPAIHELGMLTANVPAYSPNAISEHTVMLILMILRKIRVQMHRIEANNFVITGLQTTELRNLTVGVIGTGRIGSATIHNLSGFGCKIIASDLYENPTVKDLVTYKTREEVFAESDVLVFHCPLNAESHHLIDANAIKSMKDGVILINTARGGLFDFKAVLDALKSGKVSGLGIDVYENENLFLRKNLTDKGVDDALYNELISMENVIYTTHTAFYTDEAMRNMIGTSLQNLQEYITTGTCKNEVKG